jgi:transposase
MSIVGGLDIHRKQITFDYVDTETGEVRRGRICPADREHLAKWLARFAGQDAHFALEGCTGWRYVAGEIIAAGLTPHLADPAEAAHLRGPKRRAKTDRADARHQRVLLEQGRLPGCWVPPSHVLECRALLETYLDLREQRTGWVQRIHAVLFCHGAPHIAGQQLGTAEGAAALRAAAAHCSPAGQLQLAIAAQMLLVYDERLHQVRRPLPDRARHTRAQPS